ncbi:MAG: very short patch repair endonuclease [Bacteroidales bacterium]|nr:very short patch repair endonuclease [Bacteroidales bacterium]
MTDTMTAEQRHRCMSHIRSRDTKPELKVRRWLWHHGYRYRLNVKSVPGKPDIVMRPYRTAIFVNGCFWHGHGVQLPAAQIENSKLKIEKAVCSENSRAALIENSKLKSEKVADPGAALIENSACCKIPQSNRAFWVAKIRRNQERDQQNYQLLQENGWQVIVVWECQLTPKQIEHTMREVELLLNNNMLARYKHSPNPFTTEEEPLPLAAEDTIEYQDK